MHIYTHITHHTHTSHTHHTHIHITHTHTSHTPHTHHTHTHTHTSHTHIHTYTLILCLFKLVNACFLTSLRTLPLSHTNTHTHTHTNTHTHTHTHIYIYIRTQPHTTHTHTHQEARILQELIISAFTVMHHLLRIQQARATYALALSVQNKRSRSHQHTHTHTHAHHTHSRNRNSTHTYTHTYTHTHTHTPALDGPLCTAAAASKRKCVFVCSRDREERGVRDVKLHMYVSVSTANRCNSVELLYLIYDTMHCTNPLEWFCDVCERKLSKNVRDMERECV